MIVTPQIGLRLGGIGLLAVLVQLVFFSKIHLWSVAPDVLPSVAVALGLLGGAVVGAVAGFGLGVLIDSVLVSTLGVTSLALIAAGYMAGRFRESFGVTHPVLAIVLAVAGTFSAAAIVGVIAMVLGPASPVSVSVIREAFIQAALAVPLMAGVYPLVRRALGPALVETGRSEREAGLEVPALP